MADEPKPAERPASQPVAGRDYPCENWNCPLPHVTRRCGPVFASYHPEAKP